MLGITTLHNSMSISSRGFAFGFPKMARTNEDVFLTYKPMINTLISQRETPFQQSSTFSRSSLFLTEYMVQQLGIEKDGVAEMNQFLYRNYGTSMAGLKAIGYEFDNDHYHSFVHGRLPYHNLKRDPVLRALLLSLPIRKVIFSNADDVHVAKVLNRLGLEGCFDRIICFETLNSSNDGSESDSKSSTGDIDIDNDIDNDTPPPLPATPILCKPSPNAFESALKIANIDPKRTLFFDDSIRNIKTGKSIGLHTVLVGSSNRGNGVDYALESIHNIREALPELWEVDEKMKNRRLSGKIALETSIVMA